MEKENQRSIVWTETEKVWGQKVTNQIDQRRSTLNGTFILKMSTYSVSIHLFSPLVTDRDLWYCNFMPTEYRVSRYFTFFLKWFCIVLTTSLFDRCWLIHDVIHSGNRPLLIIHQHLNLITTDDNKWPLPSNPNVHGRSLSVTCRAPPSEELVAAAADVWTTWTPGHMSPQSFLLLPGAPHPDCSRGKATSVWGWRWFPVKTLLAANAVTRKLWRPDAQVPDVTFWRDGWRHWQWQQTESINLSRWIWTSYRWWRRPVSPGVSSERKQTNSQHSWLVRGRGPVTWLTCSSSEHDHSEVSHSERKFIHKNSGLLWRFLRSRLLLEKQQIRTRYLYECVCRHLVSDHTLHQDPWESQACWAPSHTGPKQRPCGEDGHQVIPGRTSIFSLFLSGICSMHVCMTERCQRLNNKLRSEAMLHIRAGNDIMLGFSPVSPILID